jgi:cholesterol transport system auxiliary component
MKTTKFLLVFVVTAAASGCGSSSMSEKRSFVPDVQREPPAAAAVHKDMTLQVNEFTIEGSFKTKGLVYRKSETQYTISYYNELMQPPADLFTEQARRWFTSSGMFAGVVQPGSVLHPTHILEGRITQYYIDMRDPKASVAVVKADIVLVSAGDKQTAAVWNKVCQASEPLASPTAEGAVAALAACTRQVLRQVEEGLAAATF